MSTFFNRILNLLWNFINEKWIRLSSGFRTFIWYFNRLGLIREEEAFIAVTAAMVAVSFSKCRIYLFIIVMSPKFSKKPAYIVTHHRENLRSEKINLLKFLKWIFVAMQSWSRKFFFFCMNVYACVVGMNAIWKEMSVSPIRKMCHCQTIINGVKEEGKRKSEKKEHQPQLIIN